LHFKCTFKEKKKRQKINQSSTSKASSLLFDGMGLLSPCFTMFFVKHGDSKPIPTKSRLEALDVGD